MFTTLMTMPFLLRNVPTSAAVVVDKVVVVVTVRTIGVGVDA
jgi:hypothetical protein